MIFKILILRLRKISIFQFINKLKIIKYYKIYINKYINTQESLSNTPLLNFRESFMSTILTYKSDTQTLRDPSGVQRFSVPLNFARKRYGIHVVRASISAFIANVYDATQAGLSANLSNNRFTINITNGVVDDDFVVVFPTGIYDINLINLALLDIQTAKQLLQLMVELYLTNTHGIQFQHKPIRLQQDWQQEHILQL